MLHSRNGITPTTPLRFRVESWWAAYLLGYAPFTYISAKRRQFPECDRLIRAEFDHMQTVRRMEEDEKYKKAQQKAADLLS